MEYQQNFAVISKFLPAMLSHNRLSGGSNPSRPIQQKVHTVSRYGPFCFILVGEGESLRRVESAEFIVRCREVGTNLPFACRGEHCSPVAFTRWVSLTGWLQRAAYMPPLRMTRYIRYNIRSRAGLAPPLRGGEFCVLQQPQFSPSSVTCGDSFPQRGKPQRQTIQQ